MIILQQMRGYANIEVREQVIKVTQHEKKRCKQKLMDCKQADETRGQPV